MPSQRRVFMVAEQIRDLIALQLMQVADPRFSLVTVTSVIVSPDLRQAKVYWVAAGGPDRIPDVQEAFAHAAGRFKRVLSKALGIRFVPELHFFYDDTLDTVDEVERLFARIHEGEKSPKDSEPGSDGSSE